MDALSSEDEKRRLAELDSTEIQLNEAAQTIIDQVNKAADGASDYDSQKVIDAWATINRLFPAGAGSLQEYIEASGAILPGSWAAGEKMLVLPENFFAHNGEELFAQDWKKDLQQFSAEGNEQAYFSGNITVSVYLDGEEVGDIVTERVEANMTKETNTRSKTGG